MLVYQGMTQIPIIFENSDLLVINKPAGLVVHDDGVGKVFTIVDWLIEQYPELVSVGEPLKLPNGKLVNRPGIVHRLDRDTSGVMVIAKNQPTFLFLKEQFQNHLMEKTYQAIVYGEIKEDRGEINYPIGRSRKDPRLRIAHAGAVGKLREAVTQYEVLERFGGFTFLAAYPKTGRTHQIRVHFKAIHHPIVCDELYAQGKPGLPGLERQALHAASLKLSLPSGERREFKAELPQDISSALDHLRSAC